MWLVASTSHCEFVVFAVVSAFASRVFKLCDMVRAYAKSYTEQLE